MSIGSPNAEDEQFLLRAFRSFSEVALSLELSYRTLRTEAEGLRRELTESNSDLARSAEENCRMRAFLDRILDRLPCGVLVVSGEGEISKANSEALRLLGWDCKAGRMRNVSDLPPAIESLLERSQGGSEAELRFTSSAGTEQWLTAQQATVDQDSASIFILSDVTERKRFEEAQARLRREQALAEMTTLLAHEVRNPLGSLELFAGLLAESVVEGESRKWVEHMQAGLRTLAATVNNVLQFHSQPAVVRSPLDLGSLLEWAREFFTPLAKQSGITLSLQNRLFGTWFPADRHRLEQVLLNLVLNSVRAMPGGGWIELAGRRLGGGEVALVVSDTGPGISPEDLPHIFEPGFSRRSESPGLGLPVCRKIVEQHGGLIRASSRPGGGAVFTVTFPRNGFAKEGSGQ